MAQRINEQEGKNDRIPIYGRINFDFVFYREKERNCRNGFDRYTCS